MLYRHFFILGKKDVIFMFGGIHTDGHGNSIELFNFILAQTGFLLVFLLSMRFIAQRIPKRLKRKTTQQFSFTKISRRIGHGTGNIQEGSSGGRKGRKGSARPET
jgi:hypothetical protein